MVTARQTLYQWIRFVVMIAYALVVCSSTSDAAVAPNQLIGSCLTDDWADSVAKKLKIDRHERDSQGRLVHPFLRAALQHPLHVFADDRTVSHKAYDPSCITKGSVVYGVGATVNETTGDVLDTGHVNGSLILELSGWMSQSLSTLVFSVVAGEVMGYPITHYYDTDTLRITERMSSVGAGVCMPTHANMEVWLASIELALQVYANESYPVGPTGFFGRVGLYTTTDFVESSVDPAKHSAPLFADFWKGYKYYEELIQAVPVSSLRNNSNFFPPKELGCADGSYGCVNHCSRSPACELREARGKECMVVAMMYDNYDPGYLQAVLSNIGFATYFCFLGYDGLQDFVVDAQKRGQPVLFYHYEPDLFHINNADLFQRIFLPRPVPERVVLATGYFGGNATNPVDVDFPTTKLMKFATSRAHGTPAGQLLANFALQELDINDLLRKYLAASQDPAEQDATFRAACRWVRENYRVWSLWLDRPPICSFETHVQYSVSGCDDSHRVITFAWAHPNPDNGSQPYNCDGGLTKLPSSLLTSRSCSWIKSDSNKWRDWVYAKPECDESFFMYTVSECAADTKRTVHYWWLLADPADATKSQECEGGLTLPPDVLVECEYMPTSSSAFFVVVTVSAVLIVVQIAAIAFVFRHREKPIIKRSQYETQILMQVGSILIYIAVVLYAGKPTAVLCAGRPITISLGFTTIFGSLFVKSLRVYRVFFRSGMKRMAVTIAMMMKVFAFLFVVDVLILAGWFIIDFPQPTVTTATASEFRGEIERHTCESTSFIFTAVLIFWKTIVLFLGLYLSFLIRNVSSDFQESIWIFTSTIIVLVACLVMLPLAYVVELPADVFYVFLACALLLSTTLIMGMMLIPKLLRLNEGTKSSSHASDAISNGSPATLAVEPKSTSTVRPRPPSRGASYIQPMRGTTESDGDHMSHTSK